MKKLITTIAILVFIITGTFFVYAGPICTGKDSKQPILGVSKLEDANKIMEYVGTSHIMEALSYMKELKAKKQLFLFPRECHFEIVKEGMGFRNKFYLVKVVSDDPKYKGKRVFVLGNSLNCFD